MGNNSQEEPKITMEDIRRMQADLRPTNISQIKVIENTVLPDDVIVVSSKIFAAIKASAPEHPIQKETQFWGNAI